MFNLTVASIAIGLVALIIASLFDIKTREVPDWLNYGLVAFALGGSLILSIYHGYTHIIINSLLGLVVGLVIGLAMFYTGQWGGGDSKLIIGISTLVGFSLSELSYTIPTLLIFFINILLVGAIYGIIFSFVKALLNFKGFKEDAERRMRGKDVLVIRIVLLVIGLGAFLFLLITRSIESAILFGFALVLFLLFYLWAFVSVVEKTCMIKQVMVKDLTEGDWVVNPVVKKKGKKMRIILKPTRTGITLQQIARLRKHNIRKVTVKIGVPFVPSFLIAYILTFWLGNWLIFLV